MSKIFEYESDTEMGFQTDNDYAKNYDQWRKKEEINKLKTKYQNDSESSSSESDDDEEGIEITEKVEKDFFKTLACLKNKDPRIYDENVRFFDDENNDSTKNTIKNSTKNRKSSVYLKDYERNLILEKGGILSDEEDNHADNTDQSPTYVEEQQQAKEKLKNVLNSIEDKSEGDWGGIFTKREKTAKEKEKEETDYKKWLAGQKEDIEDNQMGKDLKPLKEFWNDPNLDDGEKFLRDFILKKQFLDHDDEDYIPTYDEVVHDSDELSNDEEMLEKQEEFEHKYNFRFEEPDQEFIKRYPRTMENSLRKKDDKRTQKRQEIKERKKKEKEIKRQELKKLQELKKREIEEKLEKLKEITGNTTLSFADDDIEDEFDPDKYDKRMNELFDDNFYQGPEGDQKPEFPDLDEELEIENWNNFYKDEDNDKNDNIGHCEDEDFNMDCDYDPTVTQNESIKSKKKRKRKSKFAEAVSNPKPKFDPNDKTYEEYFDEYYKLDCEDFIGDIPCRFKYRKVIPNSFGLTVEEILSAKERELNKWCSLKKSIQIRPDHVEKYDQIAYDKKAKNIALKKKILPSLFAPEDVNKSLDSSNNSNQNENTSRFINDYNTNTNQEEINNIIENESLDLVNNDKKNVKKEQKLKDEIQDETVNDYENTLQNVDQEELIANMNSDISKTKKRKKKNRLRGNESVEISKESKRSQPNSTKLESTNIEDEDGPPKKKSRVEFSKTSKLKKHKMKRKQNKKELLNNGQNGDSEQKPKESKISKQKVKKKKKQLELPLAKISDERLSAYGIKKKKFKNKLKYKK